ncbi:MAG: hypothetical protein JST54_18390 [Deltaproteobacteria bacterium]|nr:hypothetical protein [Deltaproteobacteria bacterium]
MNAPRVPRVAEYMLKAKVIDEFQMKSALAHQAQWGQRLTKVFNELRLAPENKVVAALAHALKLQPVDLSAIPPDLAALKKLDAAYCAEKGVFPCALKDQGKTLFLAMCDPTDFSLTDEVEKKTRCRLKLLVAGETALAAAVQRCYRDSKGSKAAPPPPPMASQGMAGIELETASTGEFMDHKGEVVGSMRHVSNPRQAALPPPVAAPINTPVADELQSLFDFTPDALTPEEKQRLEAIKQNQERGNLILRVVLELCVEKGLLSSDDVNRLQL